MPCSVFHRHFLLFEQPEYNGCLPVTLVSAWAFSSFLVKAVVIFSLASPVVFCGQFLS